jgi:hypothetical protein
MLHSASQPNSLKHPPNPSHLRGEANIGAKSAGSLTNCQSFSFCHGDAWVELVQQIFIIRHCYEWRLLIWSSATAQFQSILIYRTFVKQGHVFKPFFLFRVITWPVIFTIVSGFQAWHSMLLQISLRLRREALNVTHDGDNRSTPLLGVPGCRIDKRKYRTGINLR